MATYEEIYEISAGDLDTAALRAKVAIAAVIKAVVVLAEATPTDARKAWALSALQSPIDPSLFHYVLGNNAAATQSVILAASDTTVQTAVDAAVDALYP